MALSYTLRRLASMVPILCLRNVNAVSNVACRNFARLSKLQWVRPPNLRSYDPSQTGDLKPFEMPDGNLWTEHFDSCDLLKERANDNVKKIFAMKNQSLRSRYYIYKRSLINKVKDHEYDNSSLCVRIASLTARIRIIHHLMAKKKTTKHYGEPINILLGKRRKHLRNLRNIDYKKFEWLLDQLDLKFYPDPVKKEVVTQKKATKLLAEYRKQKLKELKLGKLKSKLDLEKVPFLEKKLKTLKYIKEQENTFQLESTVTDPVIENCIEQLERVKIQVEENQKRGYVRKVHPYTLEVYDPKIFDKSNIN